MPNSCRSARDKLSQAFAVFPTSVTSNEKLSQLVSHFGPNAPAKRPAHFEQLFVTVLSPLTLKIENNLAEALKRFGSELCPALLCVLQA